MKVTLLGTGAAEGWPALFCRCAACLNARRLGGKDLRTRSSALIDDVLKLDFPPDILHQVIANNLDLCALRALLFTHAHDDHFSGAELQYLGPYFVEQMRDTLLPVCGPAPIMDWLRANLKMERLPLALETLVPWQPACIADYQVTPLIAQHDPSQPCFNYIIQDKQGASLLYATDTGWYEDTTWAFLEQFTFDGIVVECQKGLVDDGYAGHLSIAGVIALRQRLIEAGSFAPASPVVVTHLSHLSGLMHSDWEAHLSPHNIQVGFDGMTLDVPPPTLPERLRRAEVEIHRQDWRDFIIEWIMDVKGLRDRTRGPLVFVALFRERVGIQGIRRDGGELAG